MVYSAAQFGTPVLLQNQYRVAQRQGTTHSEALLYKQKPPVKVVCTI